MTDGSVQVLLTDRAKADYKWIFAEAVASAVGPGADQEQLVHFQRARNILKDLRRPGAIKYDQPMINNFSWMLSRSEGTTYVYYGRNSGTNTVVVIHLCYSTTDIYSLLADIVFAGRTEILTALGITPPPLPRTHVITIQ